uniref:Inorganic pyrophosphatase n=1 Tax=Cacopsylla melanoneura TaxID=428564 RepID=A0A8D8Z2X6_9HEMI
MDLLFMTFLLGTSVGAVLAQHGGEHLQRWKRNVDTVTVTKAAVTAAAVTKAAVTKAAVTKAAVTEEDDESNKTMVERMQIKTVEKGIPNTADYRLYFRSKQGYISPMHDVPLYSNFYTKVCNMIVEIPRWTNAKMQINLREPLNPIKQDIKHGLLRYVPNVFPHHGYIGNYGALPQTWENPLEADPNTGRKGDGDPIDVLEIGERIAQRGEIIQVKVLGVLGLIDEEETDWKIIAINVHDPNAARLNDIGDVEAFFPGYLNATSEWLKHYKIPDRKPANTLAFNGEPKNREFALSVIDGCHQQWIKLMLGKIKVFGISIKNTVIGAGGLWPFTMAEREVNKRAFKTGTPAPIDRQVEKSHFILPK